VAESSESQDSRFEASSESSYSPPLSAWDDGGGYIDYVLVCASITCSPALRISRKMGRTIGSTASCFACQQHKHSRQYLNCSLAQGAPCPLPLVKTPAQSICCCSWQGVPPQPKKKRGLLSRIFGRKKGKEHASFSSSTLPGPLLEEAATPTPTVVILNSLNHNQLLELLKVPVHVLISSVSHKSQTGPSILTPPPPTPLCHQKVPPH
jgi:hypothetical protein